MKGDFSRLTFNKTKNYSGVLMQQARVSLDADWNEQIGIIAHQRRMRTRDTLGLNGAPIHNGGFDIRYSGDTDHGLLISTGNIYVEGHLCELHPTQALPVLDSPKKNQVRINKFWADSIDLSKDKWVLICTEENPEGIPAKIKTTKTQKDLVTLTLDFCGDISGQTVRSLRRMIPFASLTEWKKPVPDQPDQTGPISDQTDFIYLDVWQRHITHVEDPDIREKALGGPDTATRIQM